MAEPGLPNDQVTERMALFATTETGRAIEYTNEAFDNENGTILVIIKAKLDGSDYSITKRIEMTVDWTNEMLDIIGADLRRMMSLADEAEQVGSLGLLGEYTGGEQSIASGSCSGTAEVSAIGDSITIPSGSCSGTAVVSAVGRCITVASGSCSGTASVSAIGVEGEPDTVANAVYWQKLPFFTVAVDEE